MPWTWSSSTQWRNSGWALPPSIAVRILLLSEWHNLSMPWSMLLISSSIVAIHSPNRNPIKSFTSTTTGKIWLGDEDMLPRDIPNCRVLTFSSSGSDSIMASATRLVEDLVHNRRVRLSFLFEKSYNSCNVCSQRVISRDQSCSFVIRWEGLLPNRYVDSYLYLKAIY